MSQIVSGQKQPKTGLAESHQIKLFSKKEMYVKGGPSLFWVLYMRLKGKEPEDKELQFHNKVGWKTKFDP